MPSEKTIKNKQLIVEFLKKNGDKSAVEIGEYIGLSSARIRVLLSELSTEDKVQAIGGGRSRRYGLKKVDS